MRTYKVKLLFDDQELHDFWVDMLYTVQKCYNYASKVIFDEKLSPNIKVVHNRLYRELRGVFKTLPSQMCISVERSVIANYRAVKSNNHKIEKPIEMKNFSLQLDKRLFSNLTRESFKIGNGNSRKRSTVRFLRYPKFDELAEKYRMCDPKLTYDPRTDAFYACIPFLDIAPTPHEDLCIGVDLGMRRLATMSNGKVFSDKKYLGTRRRIRHNKRILQMHKKKSHSARKKLDKLRHREHNVSKNMCHHLANRILEQKETVVVMEDLSKIKQTTSKTTSGQKRKSHNRAIGQFPFYLLKQILTYKAPLHGKRVETVSPEYTSREDCRTQSADGCSRKGCRFYTADGRVFDADWNAAINICNRYRPTSFSLPVDGRLNLDGRPLQPANSGSGN